MIDLSGQVAAAIATRQDATAGKAIQQAGPSVPTVIADEVQPVPSPPADAASAAVGRAQVPPPTKPAGIPPAATPPDGISPATGAEQQAAAPASDAAAVDPDNAPKKPARVVSTSEAVTRDAQTGATLTTVRHDGSDGETFPITEDTFDIGRRAGQMRFDDDPYLSDRHCRLSFRESGWHVEDLNSLNGVYTRLTASKGLRDGDHLLVGRHLFRFCVPSTMETDAAPAVEHGVMVFGSPLQRSWGYLREIVVSGVDRAVYFLYRSPITLGREGADITFPDDHFMSRQHVALALIDGRPQVEDLASSNGTFCRIAKQTELVSGDMFRAGDQLLRFELP